MSHLLDVNLLIQGIWRNHSRHAETFAWLEGKSLCVCPLAELGFLRISTGIFKAPMSEARALLALFLAERNDLPALESGPKTSSQVTDFYLADLAQKHGLKLATSDDRISHPAVEVVI